MENPTIVQRPQRMVAGPELVVSFAQGDVSKRIGAFWGEFFAKGGFEQIPDRATDAVCYGVCVMACPGDTMTYMIACEITDASRVPPGMACRTIPAAEFALLHTTLKEVVAAWQHLSQEWLPASPYAARPDVPAIEEYRGCPDQCGLDICIAVRRK